MEELIEEYKALGLNYGQAVMAITKGISPEQIKGFRALAIQLQKSMEEVAETIMNGFQNSKDFIKEIENMRLKKFEEDNIKKRGKKGKNVKPWQKNKFYQK